MFKTKLQLTRKKSGIGNGDHRVKSLISEIQSDLRLIEQDRGLCQEKNFDKRMEVIDFIGFQITDRIEALLKETDHPDKLLKLKYRAEKARHKLEMLNSQLFQKLQAFIRTGQYTGAGFKNLVNEYVGFNLDSNEYRDEIGYDNLDIFINGLFSFQDMPEQTKDLEPEMVYYQKTPARVVFELAEKSSFRKEDVFFDLGSGLGQAAILVNLLAGVKVKGVEFEPAFCDYAGECAAQLRLPGVTFINADARKTDYAEGTVFFMFTPFRGKILQEVLEILRKEALQRRIKIFTYGPCTARVALQNWLDFEAPKDDSHFKLGVFTSL